jgi:hypothetical protein
VQIDVKVEGIPISSRVASAGSASFTHPFRGRRKCRSRAVLDPIVVDLVLYLAWVNACCAYRDVPFVRYPGGYRQSVIKGRCGNGQEIDLGLSGDERLVAPAE